MTRLELLKSRGLQSPDNISKYINQLRLLYLKKSSNIVLELIKEWENKLENKLNELNLIK
jgi:hypothetical protein